jgi:predicted outer membrane repeat protein
MDTTWFDTLTKSVSRPGSRRGLVRLAAVLPLAGAVRSRFGTSPAGADQVSAENCTPEGKRCGGGGKRRRPCKKCCTKNVITDQNGRKRCSCVRPGNGCSNDSQCCEGLCTSGTCRVSDPGPTPVPCTGLKPTATGATKGLQEAINAAEAGDALTLCAGTWNLTDTVYIRKDLTLIGAGAGATSLDGANAVRVLHVYSVTVTLQDLTIRNGNTVYDHGGGMFVEINGNITLLGVRVTGNTAKHGGGGIFTGSPMSLDAGSSVTGNTAREGGGIMNGISTVTLESGAIICGNSEPECLGSFNGTCPNCPS